MFCSISGTVPEEPVISKQGHLFEKRLVEKYVKETGKCPVTGESLSLDDLLAVKTNKTVKARTATAASIPGVLSTLYDEWDAAMLETHTLRKQLHEVRQELSHSLYQHDAAVRVIARLVRERDEARAIGDAQRQELLAELAAKRAAPAAAEPDGATAAAEADGPAAKRAKKAALPEAVVNDLVESNQSLSKARKKRTIPDSLATPEDVGALRLLHSFPLHKTTAGGIVSIDFAPDSGETVVATAGLDATVQIFDVAAGRSLASLEGHTKRLTSVVYLTPEVLLSSSADKTARVWRGGPAGSGAQFKCAGVLSDHSAEVVGITPHPSKKYFVTGSADASWSFYDLETLTCLRQVAAGGEDGVGAGEAFTCVQFHPDGLILGTGTDKNIIRIWEVKGQKNVATFEGHTKPVRCLAFSENGYHLASAADDCVKLWDLRRLKNFKTIEHPEAFGCAAVAFDYSGQYLGVGGADTRIYGHKQDWQELATLGDLPRKGVHALKLGADCKTAFVGSVDHNLRIYGLQQA